jgi:uncharacterized DUF497 family protein
VVNRAFKPDARLFQREANRTAAAGGGQPPDLSTYIIGCTIMSMATESDPKKRKQTLAERGLDFERADEVFAGHHFTMQDIRKDYGEDRCISVGLLDARMVVMVWTQRGKVRRIISMRKANEREIKKYAHRLG